LCRVGCQERDAVGCVDGLQDAERVLFLEPVGLRVDLPQSFSDLDCLGSQLSDAFERLNDRARAALTRRGSARDLAQ
jgi:hypothetical protein